MVCPNSYPAQVSTRGENPRGGQIRLELGTRRTNVGSLRDGALYDAIYKALQTACRPAFVMDCKQTKAAIPVYGEDGLLRTNSELEVQVNMIDNKGSNATYYLLIGAVAGAVERGRGQDDANCRWFNTHRNWRWLHCNTVNSVGVFFPNGACLKVSLKSKFEGGSFGCGKMKDMAGDYLRSLSGEIEQSVGTKDLSEDVKCCDNGQNCDFYEEAGPKPP